MSDKSYDEWVDHCRDRCEECKYLDTNWVCGVMHVKITELRSCGIKERMEDDTRRTVEDNKGFDSNKRTDGQSLDDQRSIS